jgi:hypothetical protein
MLQHLVLHMAPIFYIISTTAPMGMQNIEGDNRLKILSNYQLQLDLLMAMMLSIL